MAPLPPGLPFSLLCWALAEGQRLGPGSPWRLPVANPMGALAAEGWERARERHRLPTHFLEAVPASHPGTSVCGIFLVDVRPSLKRLLASGVPGFYLVGA